MLILRLWLIIFSFIWSCDVFDDIYKEAINVFVCLFDMHSIFKTEFKFIWEIFLQQFFSIFADHNSTTFTIRFHFIANYHINAIHVVSDNLCAYYSSKKFALIKIK